MCTNRSFLLLIISYKCATDGSAKINGSTPDVARVTERNARLACNGAPKAAPLQNCLSRVDRHPEHRVGGIQHRL